MSMRIPVVPRSKEQVPRPPPGLGLASAMQVVARLQRMHRLLFPSLHRLFAGQHHHHGDAHVLGLLENETDTPGNILGVKELLDA